MPHIHVNSAQFQVQIYMFTKFPIAAAISSGSEYILYEGRPDCQANAIGTSIGRHGRTKDSRLLSRVWLTLTRPCHTIGQEMHGHESRILRRKVGISVDRRFRRLSHGAKCDIHCDLLTRRLQRLWEETQSPGNFQNNYTDKSICFLFDISLIDLN